MTLNILKAAGSQFQDVKRLKKKKRNKNKKKQMFLPSNKAFILKTHRQDSSVRINSMGPHAP